MSLSKLGASWFIAITRLMALPFIQGEGTGTADAHRSAQPSAVVRVFWSGRLWRLVCLLWLPVPVAAAELSIQPTNGGVVVSWQMPACSHPTNCLAYQLQWSGDLSFRSRFTWWIGENDGALHRRFFPVAPSTTIFFRVIGISTARKRRGEAKRRPSWR